MPLVEASMSSLKISEHASDNLTLVGSAVKLRQSVMDAAGKVRESMVEAVAVADENAAAAGQMTAGIAEVQKSIESVAAVSDENAASAQEVSASAEEVGASSEMASASTPLMRWPVACRSSLPSSRYRRDQSVDTLRQHDAFACIHYAGVVQTAPVLPYLIQRRLNPQRRAVWAV